MTTPADAVDELPTITMDITRRGGLVGPIPSPTADTEAGPGHGGGASRDDDSELPTRTGLSDNVRRWAALVALSLLLVAGLVGAYRVGASGDVSLGHEAVSGAQEVALPRSQPAGPGTDDAEAAVPADGAESGSATTSDPDDDGDGALDVDDNCPSAANGDQGDIDGDTIGDACDPDDDNDGTADESDNCPLVANSAQDDVDADGLGDACDDFPDRDDDGIIDTNDPCIEEPDDSDADGDGTPDRCDASPRGMIAVAASAQIKRVSILNQAYDGEPDMFGDLTVAGTNFDLPEISNQREIRPSNWQSDQVSIEPDSSLVQVRIWIRDEAGFCLFCRDGLVDITPESGSNPLHLLINTSTGAVDLADTNWAPVATVGTLTGPEDGNVSGTITLQGDDDSVHLASIDVTLGLVRQPAP